MNRPIPTRSRRDNGLLLICSNAFMTMAWYGHLRFKSTHLLVVILISWLIAAPRVRTASAGQPHRSRAVFGAAIKDHPGSDLDFDFVVFSILYLGSAALERLGGVCPGHAGRGRDAVPTIGRRRRPLDAAHDLGERKSRRVFRREPHHDIEAGR